jgi:hypothetical protein
MTEVPEIPTVAFVGSPFETIVYGGVPPVIDVEAESPANKLKLLCPTISETTEALTTTVSRGELLSPTRIIVDPRTSPRNRTVDPLTETRTFVGSFTETIAYGGVPPEIVAETESPRGITGEVLLKTSCGGGESGGVSPRSLHFHVTHATPNSNKKRTMDCFDIKTLL